MSALSTKRSFYMFPDTKYKLHTWGSGIKKDLDFSKTTLPSTRLGDNDFKITMKIYFEYILSWMYFNSSTHHRNEGITRILPDVQGIENLIPIKHFLGITWRLWSIKSITLSEVGQRKTNIIWYHLYVESKKNETNQLIYKTEIDGLP